MSSLLLDTHVLLWATTRTARLPAAIASRIADSGNWVYFSAVSIWEIAIKAALRKPHFDAEAAEIMSAAVIIGFEELPITASVGASVSRLPFITEIRSTACWSRRRWQFRQPCSRRTALCSPTPSWFSASIRSEPP